MFEMLTFEMKKLLIKRNVRVRPYLHFQQHLFAEGHPNEKMCLRGKTCQRKYLDALCMSRTYTNIHLTFAK